MLQVNLLQESPAYVIAKEGKKENLISFSPFPVREKLTCISCFQPFCIGRGLFF